MRYSILGFNQAKVIKTNLDLTDLMLLQYIMQANGNPEMKHLIKDDISYVWLSHKKIQEDLPILDIAEKTLRNRLTNLKKDGWILSETTKLHTGTNTYYSVSLNCISLINDVQKQDEDVARPSERACARPSERTSDNKLIDNKLIDKSTNVDLEQSSITPTKKSKGRLIDIPDTSNNKNPKKKNLYDKCLEHINNFTEDEELRERLVEYLKVRLERKDIPLGNAGFKGSLDKLNRITQNKQEQLRIIQNAIDKSYPTFYPLFKNSKSVQDKSVFNEFGVVKSIHSNEEAMNVQF